jgi:hypothetical protein
MKKNTEDYFFKKNLKCEILDFKINNLKELQIEQVDSIIKRFIKNKLLKVAIDLSGQSTDDYFKMDNAFVLKFIKEAGDTKEFINYSADLKKHLGQKAYEVHAYSKYVVMDQNGNNRQNKLHEDRTYLLSINYEVIGLIN